MTMPMWKVVAAGAVVVKNAEANTVVGGVPARLIRRYQNC